MQGRKGRLDDLGDCFLEAGKGEITPGPKVLFEEITIDLRETRLTGSDHPRTRLVCDHNGRVKSHRM